MSQEPLQQDLRHAFRVFDCSKERSGILVKGQRGLVLENLAVEVVGEQEHQEAAIYVHESEDITIRNCTIVVFGSGGGIVVRGGRNVRIEGCLVIMPKDSFARKNQAIQITGTLPANQKDTWKKGGAIVTAPNSPEQVSISGCLVWGGYYGLGLSSARQVTVESSHFLNNMRGMSIQDGSSNVTIRNCLIRDNVSAGIHFAYGAKDSLVEDNTVTSCRAEGEGFLQAYVGCSNVTFRGNTLKAEGEGPKYYLYTGIASTGIRFQGNTVQGAARKAHVGLEAYWDSKIPDNRHRNVPGATQDDGMSRGPSSASFASNALPAAYTAILTSRPGFQATPEGDIQFTRL